MSWAYKQLYLLLLTWLNLPFQELDKFEKAMKDEEFRKLLVEYAKEISDPENKKVCWFNPLSHPWNIFCDRISSRPKDLNEPHGLIQYYYFTPVSVT